MLLYEKCLSGSAHEPQTPALARADEITARLNNGDRAAILEFVSVFEDGASFFLRRHSGCSVQNPLMVARRIVAGVAEQALRGRITTGQEAARIVLAEVRKFLSERRAASHAVSLPTTPAIVGDHLAALPELDRRALVRFFGMGESVEAICNALQLQEDEFFEITRRARKSVASAVSTLTYSANATR